MQKTVVYHIKKIIHHTRGLVHKHRHFLPVFSHILLFIVFASFYRLTGLIAAQEVANDQVSSVESIEQMSPSDTEVSSAGEVLVPEISEEIVVAIDPLKSDSDPILSGNDSEILSGTDLFLSTTETITSGQVLEVVVNEMGDVVSVSSNEGLVTSTGEILSGEILSGEILSGEILSGEILSGEILSGEILINSEINQPEELVSQPEELVNSGNLITDDEQTIFPLSVLYPSEDIQFNTSGYVIVSSLQSVITTGGMPSITYCSRITYENILRILKAGTRTEPTNALLRNDAEQIINQGISDTTLLEVSRQDLENIFSDSLNVINASIYDIYTTLLLHGEKIYHRITILYGDDGVRYVLDPLRGNKSLMPQKLYRYLGYYNDEIDVHRYIGQGYSPYVIKNEITLDTQFIQNIENITDKFFSGNILTEKIMPSQEVVVPTKEVVPEPITPVVETGVVTEIQVVVETGTAAVTDTGIREEIVETGIVAEIQTVVETGTAVEIGIVVETGEILAVPSTGEIQIETMIDTEALSTIGNISGLNNLLFVFDPFANFALYNNLLAETGFVNVLSGYQYVTGDTIGLIFDSVDKEVIINYLMSRGYGTGDVTLLPVDYTALIGDSVLNFSLLSGQLLIPIVLQSTNEMSGQIAEVEIPEGTLLKTSDGSDFTGDLMPPVFLDPNTFDTGIDENMIAVIDVGSDQHINFEDANGNSLNAIFRVPVPGTIIGDIVSINYSEDGQEWTYLDAVEVVDIDGESYVIFEANHFTHFSVTNNPGANIDGNMFAKGRNGEDLNADFILYNHAGSEVKLRGQNQKIPPGLYEADLIPASGPIKKIRFNNLNINANSQNINLDTNISGYADRFSQRYAIDPSTLDFDSATVTVTATGKDLFKCTAWNFTGQTCNGKWKKIADVVPGQEYTFEITPQDPGFGESNKKVNVLDKQQFLVDSTQSVISTQNNISTIEIVPQTIQAVEKIKVKDLNETSSANDIIIDTTTSGSSTSGNYATGLVVIDTTALAADSVSTTITVAQDSKNLLKCTLWDDVSASCLDVGTSQGWKKEENIGSGQTNVTLVSQTPGRSVWGQSADDVILLDKQRRVLNFDENIIAHSNNPQIKDVHIELYKIKPKAIKIYSYDSAAENTGLFIEYTPPATYAINPEEINFEWAEVSTTAIGKDLFKCAEFDFATQTCLGKWKKLKNIKPGQDYNFILTQKDPSFTETTKLVTLIDQNDNLLSYNETVLSSGNGLFDIEITPQTGSIDKITIHDHNESGAVNDLRIAEANLSGFVQSYSIDPVGLNFVDADVTAKAKGNVLYKCKAWDFTGQICNGSWTKLMNITPGQDYTFTLTPEDPGFAEGVSADLTIWDDTDSTIKYMNESVNFYANYINSSSGAIYGSGVWCEIKFNTTGSWTSPVNMNWNLGSGYYEYNRDFNTTGTYSWNVLCNGFASGYDILDVTDTLTITADITIPTATILYSLGSGSTTSGNVFATITGFSETVTGLNSTGHLFTGNGSFVFTYTDLAGNTGSTTATVTRIDKISPTANIIYSITGLTNQNVIVTLTGYSESITLTNNSGSSTYTFTGNNSFTFTFIDAAGNTGSTIATVTWIDKISPTATISYAPATLTSGNVFATITGFSETITGLNTTGYIFTGNGNFVFTFSDLAGNTGSLIATVTGIDKTAPLFTGVTTGNIYTNVSITFSDLNLSGATLSGINGTSYYSGNFQNGSTINIDGTYLFTVYDVAGNVASAIFIINNSAPTASVNYDLTTLTSGNVVVTLTGYSEAITIINNGGSNTYTFTGNTSFTFIFVNSIGITGTTDATVTWIDKTTPIATVSYSSSSATSGNVVASISGSEAITIINNSGSINYTFTGNGNFTFNFVDVAGNTGSTIATVTGIDKTNPTANVIYSTTGITTGNVYVTLTGYAENIIITNNSGSNTYLFTENGSFVFTYIDLAGNTGSTTATVTRIDKINPTATISYAPGSATSGNVVAILTGLSETVTGLNTTEHFFTGNGSFTFTYTDLAGNTGATTSTVTRIDKNSPTASVIYSITGLTNQNVIAILTGYSESLTITNNLGVNTYTFTGNTSFTFTFIDTAGNTGSTIATVTRIDKINPTATIAYSTTGISTGNIHVLLTGFSETGIIITNNGGSNEYIFTGNGSFVFNFIDLAGNTGSTTARVIGIFAPSTLVYQNLTLSGNSDSGFVFVFSGTPLTVNNSTNISGYIQLSSGINISVSGNDRDGILYSPRLITGVAVLGELGLLSTGNLYSTVLVGGSGTSLIASTGYFFVSFIVSNGTIGETLNVYRSDDADTWIASVPDSTCVLDNNKICSFRTNHFSYFTVIGSPSIVASLPSGPSSASLFFKDKCILDPGLGRNLLGANKNGIDDSPSYYDGTCAQTILKSLSPNHYVTTLGNIKGSNYSSEFNQAYLYAYDLGLISENSIQKADLNAPLTRKYVARILSEYALRVTKLTPDKNKKCNFTDISRESQEVKYYTKLSCKLGIMGLQDNGIDAKNQFMPNAIVTRAELSTIISRLLWGHTYDNKKLYYRSHLTALKNIGVINDINPNIKEIRGGVMLMMMRINIKGINNVKHVASTLNGSDALLSY